MSHIVLLGDSIFDNASYVPGEKPVIEQLKSLLPANTKASLLAVDGSVTGGVASQLKRLPSGATDLVLSVGGNDAIQCRGQIYQAKTAEALLKTLTTIRLAFSSGYTGLLDSLAAKQLPVTVCTVYNAIPGLQEHEKTLLSIFNDIIVLESARRGFLVIDLRLVCTEQEDYSVVSAIEPSAKGGMKICRAIINVYFTKERISSSNS
ncbi:MAG: SGNH/GDSL hydrolase family protein [Spirochaetales bacterium]|nr:MAG: SGNH/GDSL hydrolase family protein [Spirochaetales bacterium]